MIKTKQYKVEYISRDNMEIITYINVPLTYTEEDVKKIVLDVPGMYCGKNIVSIELT